MPGKIALPSKIQMMDQDDGEEFPKVEILGYTGNSVSLAGYPYYIDDPVVYNSKGIEMKNNIPYFEDHSKLLGHTIKNSVDEQGNIRTVALHSAANDETKTTYQNMKNGIPYQASMGLEIKGEDVTYVAEGTVQVNNRTFEAPIFVVNKSKMTEMTATLSGRDSDTEIHTLSKEYDEGKQTLMTIKNSTKPAPKGKATPPQEETPTLVEGVIDNSTPTPAVVPIPTEPVTVPATVDNSTPTVPAPVPTTVKNSEWLFDYLEHPQLVKNARKEGWNEDRMKREIEVSQIENSYPGVPGVTISDNKIDNSYAARLAYGYGVSLETIEHKLGKPAAEYADTQGPMALKESLMVCANSNGGKFNGHSDVKNMNKFVRRLVVNNAFSTIDYPNLMHQVTEWKLEERWKIDQPQAPAMCKVQSNKDFRKSGHLKPKGGRMWEGLSNEGKIKHGSFGREDTYETQLNTIAQIVTFKREDIVNDDMGWIEESLDAMLEGAMMVPDYMLVNLIYGATAAGVLTNGTSKFTLALNEANLSTVYNKIRRQRITKTSADGDKKVNGRFNTRWDLVISPDLEETAWDIIKQDRIVAGTGDKVGDKNYWFNRLDIKTFENLDNDTYHTDAAANTWMLMPQRETYRPFAITYLNRQQRPTTETVDLPADELGFGVRGYWDVNVDYRPVEDKKLQAFALSQPA